MDELDNFEGEERRLMMERVQRLLDVAAAQNEAGCRTEAPQRPTTTFTEIKARRLGH